MLYWDQARCSDTKGKSSSTIQTVTQPGTQSLQNCFNSFAAARETVKTVFRTCTVLTPRSRGVNWKEIH